MYEVIDAHKMTYQKAITLFRNRLKPINAFDEIINFSKDLDAKDRILSHIDSDTLDDLCLYPERCSVEQIALIAGVYKVNFHQLLLICAEHMAIQLYTTSEGSLRVQYLQDLFRLKEKRLTVSPLSRGFYQDLQNFEKDVSKATRTSRRKEDLGFAVRL